MLEVCLLGTGGMMPLPDRWLTSLLVRYNGGMLLIDCGEGTQIPIKLAGWGFKNIEAVLFTHYHADHTAGLPGFLLTLGNSGRTEPLTLIGPPGLAKVAEGLTIVSPELPYELKIIELPYFDGSGTENCETESSETESSETESSETESSETVYSVIPNSEIWLGDILVRSMPVDHNIPCLAYSIELKRQGKFDPERARRLNIPVTFWNTLQKGNTVQLEDKTVLPEMVLGKPRKGIKISYCTDTRPTDGLADFIRNSDLFICEGMYGDESESQKAVQKKHMTFSEAAILAGRGNVKELWLTHYSPSLNDPEAYLESVGRIFPNAVTGKDLMKRQIRFDDE